MSLLGKCCHRCSSLPSRDIPIDKTNIVQINTKPNFVPEGPSDYTEHQTSAEIKMQNAAAMCNLYRDSLPLLIAVLYFMLPAVRKLSSTL